MLEKINFVRTWKFVKKYLYSKTWTSWL